MIPPDKDGSIGHATYSEMVRKFAGSHPLSATVLMRAEKNRLQTLTQLFSGARLKGIEELLGYLHQIAKSHKAHPLLRRTVNLVERAIADFETALECSLSRLNGVVADSMRDVMEIEFLLRDFRFEPHRIEDWLSADQKRLRQEFQAGVLRQRHATRKGVKPEQMAENVDYKAHSASLHVTPFGHPYGMRGFVIDAVPFSEDSSFWEIFEHARRFVLELHAYSRSMEPTGEVGPDPAVSLPAFKSAWERTQEMADISLAILKAAEKGNEP